MSPLRKRDCRSDLRNLSHKCVARAPQGDEFCAILISGRISYVASYRLVSPALG